MMRVLEFGVLLLVAAATGGGAGLLATMSSGGRTPASKGPEVVNEKGSRHAEHPRAPTPSVRFSRFRDTHVTPLTASAAEAPSPPAPASHPSEEDDPALERHAIERLDRSFREAFQAERADPEWARSSSASLQGSMMDLGNQFGFRTESIECRTTRCMAEVKFAGRNTVRTGVGELLHARYEPNCAVTVLVGDPTNQDGSASGTVQFSCEEARVAEVLSGQPL
jgi:hypothetical protein